MGKDSDERESRPRQNGLLGELGGKFSLSQLAAVKLQLFMNQYGKCDGLKFKKRCVVEEICYFTLHLRTNR